MEREKILISEMDSKTGLTLSLWITFSILYLRLIGTFSVTNGKMFISTQQTIELMTDHLFQSRSDYL